MAEVRSIDEIGKSLLAKQASIRKSQRKRSRKDERINKALGVLKAGQSVFQSALSRRMKEYDSVNKLSQLRTKAQTPRINYQSKLYQSLLPYIKEGQDWETNYENWKKDNVGKEEFINLTIPKIHTLIEGQQGFGIYEKTDLVSSYRPLEIAGAEKMAKESFKHWDAFRLGLLEFTGTELSNDEMLKLYTSLDPADTDIRKAQIFNEHVSRMTGTPVSPANLRNLFSKLSFGLIKPTEEGNIFSRISDVPPEIAAFQNVVKLIDHDALLMEVVSTKLATHRNWENITVEDYGKVETLFDSISGNEEKFERNNLSHSIGKNRWDEAKAQIDYNPSLKSDIITKSGGLANRFLRDSNFRKEITKRYAAGEYTQEIPSSNEVKLFEQRITTPIGAREIAIMTVIGTSFKDKQSMWRWDVKPHKGDNFDVDFSIITNLLKPAYELKDGKLTPTNPSGNVTEEDQIGYVQDLHQDQEIPFTTEEKDKILDTIPDLSQVTRDKAIRDLDAEEDDEFLFGEEDEYHRNVTPFGPSPEEGARRRKIVSEGWENLKWEAGDRAALEKFATTGKTTGSYGRETRFYEALERAGLPRNATQEMVRKYLES